MKEKITFLMAMLCLMSINLSSQCTNCTGNGITMNSETSYTASSADAFFWEVCDGNATITGSNENQTVTISCGDTPSTLRLVRFNNGVCTESCIAICPIDPPECECPNFGPDGCIGFSYEDCATAFYNILPHCLPDPECISTISWVVGLGSYEDTIFNNSTILHYNIPSGNWPNHWLVVFANITLTNGDVCTYRHRFLIDCRDGKPGGGGQAVGIDPNTNSSANRTANAIYPNPITAGTELRLSQDVLNNAVNIELINSNGEVVSRMKDNEYMLTIPSNLTAGIYFVSVQRLDGFENYKLIIKD